MSSTSIEWCDYSLNPVKGLCPVACSYCYARRMYKRYHWNETIRFEHATFLRELGQIHKPSRIFVGSTMDLFGDWVQKEWMEQILDVVKYLKQHTFIFLTKRPAGMAQWSFPDNCWVGVSMTEPFPVTFPLKHLAAVQAKVKFVSFEPLLEWGYLSRIGESLERAGVNWVIIGQQTPVSKKTAPEPAWVQDILVGAHNAGCLPVFIKDNLVPVLAEAWPGWTPLREFPR